MKTEASSRLLMSLAAADAACSCTAAHTQRTRQRRSALQAARCAHVASARRAAAPEAAAIAASAAATTAGAALACARARVADAAAALARAAPLGVASLHCAGANDPLVPRERTGELAALFAGGALLDHDGAHQLPPNSLHAAIRDFVAAALAAPA